MSSHKSMSDAGQERQLSASTIRMLQELPASVQKDIGWPVSQNRPSTLSRLMANIWGHAQ